MRDALFRIAQELHRSCGGRITPRDNLHLTLVFLGNVERARIARLKEIAAQPRIECFDLEFGAIGYFRHNRIAWAAPLAVPAPLAELVAALEQPLADDGFELDRRKYVPHITFLRDARAPESPPAAAFTWPAREYALIESARVARGHEYRVLARWPLQRA